MRRALIWVCFSVAAAGGIFFGLFSCGGYAWHWSVFAAILAIASVGAATLLRRRNIAARIAIGFAVVGVYYVSHATAAPFYPAAPAAADYPRLFWLYLAGGSC